MRVLLAEDDPLIARDVAAQLTKAGFTVAHEKDGEAALFALARQLAWTAALLLIGRRLLAHALRRVVVQGG